MTAAKEFMIQILFKKSADGRFHVHSPNLAGLHLAGRDLATIRADLEPIVKDLLFYNSNVIADKIRWVPSLEEVVCQMTQPSSAPEPQAVEQKFLMITGRAA
ncbi:MAG TPA: hypothetical protein VN980_09100 [Alphaproteobacteria bacterium]|nr:hypothetical protein [Alphaproteobacteria bacterium]